MSKNSGSHTFETFKLAWPLVLTQVGHVITGIVDNFFLGRLGVTEQAAGILSNNLFVLLLVFCIGVSYATTPLVAGAHGKSDSLSTASLFKNSLYLNLTVAIACFVILFFASGMLGHMQQPADVVKLATPFFDVLIFSLIPLSLFFACKQYCEGLSNTRIALIVSITGNIINILLNYCLIYGYCGLPELGYMGSAWATFFARLFMGVGFLSIIFLFPALGRIAQYWKQVKINWAQLRELWRIGINSAMQFTFEIAAFAIAGLMSGSFGKEQIDAHGIALQIAAFTYMFGSGIGSASTIRAARFFSNNDWQGIRNASHASIKLVLIVMGSFGVLLLIFNQTLPLAFTTSGEIVALSAKLLLIAAMFQLFDGLQVTIIGALRGLQDTRIPTLITLVGYWLLALPLAYWLAYIQKMEVIGVWIALLASLVFVGLCLWWRLYYLLRKNLER